MITFCCILLTAYAVAIGCLIYGYSKTTEYHSPKNTIPKTTFSIVVPFRNESGSLPHLLKSLSNLEYPSSLFEVILVNDASDVAFLPDHFEFKISVTDNIRRSDSPKKDAINTAIALAKNEWIITTDADCVIPQKWLTTIDSFIQQNNPQMIAGAVRYDSNNSFLQQFQQIEFASLQVTTIASFALGHAFMCNGANFGYSKSFFDQLNGFEGNENIASGDDVFLLQKALAQFPDRVSYLKSKQTIVTTQPELSWKTLFHQRVRWASKSGSYKGYAGQILGLIVFFGNLSWIVLLFATLLGELPIYNHIYIFVLKNGLDFILAYADDSLIKDKRFFMLSSLVYPFFSVCVALYSVFGKYEWKGRTFSK